MVAVGATALVATSLTLGLTSSSGPSSPFRHLRLGTTVPVYPLTPLREGTLWNRLVASGALHMPVLASRTRDGAPAPALARAWTVTDSGYTLALGVTRGLRWHDGPAVTARDLAFTLPYLAAQGRQPFLARYLARVDTVGPDSVLVRYTAPVAVHSVDWLVDTPVLPRHIWSAVARADTFSGAAALVGCGPFRLGWVDLDRRGATLLRAGDFPHPVGVDGVSFIHRESADSLVDDLRRGRLDALATFGATLPAPLIQDLMEGGGPVRLVSSAYAGVARALVFSARGLGAHRTFRTAIASALDFGSLARSVATPLARRPALSFTPSAAWSAAPSGDAWKGDLRGAHAALSSLGLTDRDGDGIREGLDGKPFTLVIEAAPGCERTAGQVARMLRGVRLRARVQAQGSTTDPPITVVEVPASSAALAGYPEVAAFGPFTHGDERDPDYLERVKRVIQSPDEGSQREALALLQEYNAEELPLLALAWDDIVVPVSERRFGGWSVSSTQGIPHGDLWGEIAPLPPPPPLRWPPPSLLFVSGLALALAFMLLQTLARARTAGTSLVRLGHALALQPGVLRRAAARGEGGRERRRGGRDRRRIVMAIPPERERRRGARERRRSARA